MNDEKHAVESIAKLQGLIDAEFSEAEAQSLKDIVIWWTRLRGALALGGALGGVAKWALLMAAFIALMKAGIVDWIMRGDWK